jgi:hypothetical protein
MANLPRRVLKKKQTMIDSFLRGNNSNEENAWKICSRKQKSWTNNEPD